MRYVKRDADGLVIAHYANEQPYATEALPDDHRDIKDFRSRFERRQRPPAEIQIEAAILGSPYVRGLHRLLAKKFGVGPDELTAMIITEAGPQMSRPDREQALDALFDDKRKRK